MRIVASDGSGRVGRNVVRPVIARGHDPGAGMFPEASLKRR